MMLHIQPARQESYSIQGITVSMSSIAAACGGLYLDYHYDPAFLILSPEDFKEFEHEVKADTTYHATFPWDMTEKEYKQASITAYINQTTGRIINVYQADWIPHGSVIFGRFEIAMVKV